MFFDLATVALTASNQIMLQDLPATVSGRYEEVLGSSLCQDDTMRAWGSRYARIVLDRCNHNKRQACRSLGISYHTLQAYLAYSGPKRKDSAGEANVASHTEAEREAP